MQSTRPKYALFKDTGKFLSSTTELHTRIPLIEERLRSYLNEKIPSYASFTAASFVQDVPSSVKRMVEDAFSVPFSDKQEAYTIVIEDSIKVYSRSERGLIYGALLLSTLAKEGYLHHGLVYESPVLDIRGVKVYLPGRAGIPFFKEFVDFCVEFRMNTITLEIGGAMEYKRHPEINEAWIRYCKEIGEYSGKADTIQNWTYDWKKNSIHVENGEGGFMTQDEVCDLVAYCREKRVDIIPEVPCFSHSDYLLLAHPELRERMDDEYPDTYCPSNEATYELLFDVLDEVIEVFGPAQINIGHDEAYTFAKCERCAGKDPVRLFIDDILRIRDHLAGRGVKTIIWGDKLLDGRIDGKPCGGAHVLKDYDDKETIEEIPAIYPARDLLPPDITVFHWYWALDDRYDEEFHQRGIPIIYGNYSPVGFRHWRQRVDRGILGVFISNWSSLKKENLQRNGIYFDIAFTNLLLWEDDYSDSMASGFAHRAMEMLYKYNYRDVRHGLRILHTTHFQMKYKLFYDGFFIVKQDYALGSYRVVFADGRELDIPISYGLNISSADNEWVYTDRKLPEVTMTTLPRRVSDKGETITAYEFIVPTDGTPVASIEFLPNSSRPESVALHALEVF